MWSFSPCFKCFRGLWVELDKEETWFQKEDKVEKWFLNLWQVFELVFSYLKTLLELCQDNLVLVLGQIFHSYPEQCSGFRRTPDYLRHHRVQSLPKEFWGLMLGPIWSEHHNCQFWKGPPRWQQSERVKGQTKKNKWKKNKNYKEMWLM